MLTKSNKSGHRGVWWCKDKNKWVAQITVDKNQIYIGAYEKIEEAIEKYRKIAISSGKKHFLEHLTEEEKLERSKIKKIEWNEKNKDRMKKYWSSYHKKRYPKDKERMSKRSKEKAQIIKREAMESYGGKCNCCNEDEIKFLTIDCIISDRKLHNEVGYGSNFYNWLKKNNYPKDNFQCLCMNCNFAKGMFGKCPHQEKRELDSANS
jgi:hypothetical protein